MYIVRLLVTLSLAATLFGCASTSSEGDTNERTSLTGASEEPDSEPAPESEEQADVLPEHHRQQLEQLREEMSACGEDDAAACAEIAKRYASGRQVPSDGRVAARFAARACELDDVEACETLVFALMRHETASDFAVGKLTSLCSEHDRDRACVFVAKLNLAGAGVERDLRRSAQLTRPRCQEGDADACETMLKAVRALPDEEKPWTLQSHMTLLERLCKDGIEQTCLALHQIYSDGVSWGSEQVAADDKQAQSYRKKAGVPAKSAATVTVYSKPRAEIAVNGQPTGQKTPGTVNVGPGRHEVTVIFEDGSTSGEKAVRTKAGSRIKLFFRQTSD